MAVRHDDLTAALDLLEKVRTELLDQPEWRREFLAHYEYQATGHSYFAATLGPASREFLEEAKVYWAAHPVSRELEAAQSLLAGAPDGLSVRHSVRTALLEGSAFSLVRMGDGEGRFAIPLSGRRSVERTDFIAKNIWFWNSSVPGDDFWEAMRSAFREADIVGSNPPYRIGFEYRNAIVGYMGVVNGNQFITDARADGAAFSVVENWLLVALGRKFFEDLIQLQGRVSFIGPHAAIAGVLAEMGARETRVIVIPSDNIVPTSNVRPHFPDVYHEVIAEIRGGVSGLWLVSGGAFGKIYCNEIRKAGGVALDIGSISDAWMGLRTR